MMAQGLVVGIILGALSWAVIAAWIAPVVGWPAVIVALAVLTGLVVWDIATTPVAE